MENSSSLIIINDKNLRGILAPPKLISKKILEDVIDFIELSSSESNKETDKRIAEADRDNSWISFDKVCKLAKETK
ncbi:hypothetical protein KJ756_02315 [Patescibacteria group bacterium]|nr:hypothetical protein [Patescibacteria group bacterium]MBU4082476.1 hypothetical protein [Patescibacteria group bacterium]